MIDKKELVNLIKKQQAEDDKAYKMFSFDDDFTVIYKAKKATRNAILEAIENIKKE
jgi:hypothetical protein